MVGKMKAIICLLSAVLLSGCTSLTKHIEDTNGSDDYSLAVITDANIVNKDLGALNISTSMSSFNNDVLNITSGVKVKSKKFSGVYEVMYGNFMFNSDVIMDLVSIDVKSGNFKACVVYDDKIIHTYDNNSTLLEYTAYDINGYLALIIAGESADFELNISYSVYSNFDNNSDINLD